MAQAFEIVRWPEPELPEMLTPLIAEALAGGYDWMDGFMPEWQQRPFLGAGEGLFLALADDGTAQAMAIISADPHNNDGRTGRLRFIFVREGARKQGLAERLVRICLGHGEGWDRITLHTDNPIAAALYARHGFEPVTGVPRSTHQLG